MELHNELKSLIDKYCMGVEPSDDQLDEILELANRLSANPKEVSDYIQEMKSGPTKEERKAKEKAERKEAEAAAKREAEQKKKRAAELEAKKEREKYETEQKARKAAELEKRKREKRETEQRVQRAAEFDRRERERREAEEKRNNKTSVYVLLCLLIGFPLFVLIFDRGADISELLLCQGVMGIIVSLIAACVATSRATSKFISWLFVLFYVVLCISSLFISSDETYKPAYKAYINANHLENFLSKEYGHEYNFQVESSETVHKRFNGKDVLFEIIVLENTTQSKDTVWLIETDEGVSRLYQSGMTISQLSEISNSISSWFDGN